MKIIIVESRKINHTPFRHFNNCWNFHIAFACQDSANVYIKAVTNVGSLFYQTLEFRTSEHEVY